jgi:Na+:H+ antiporter, NhaA family
VQTSRSEQLVILFTLSELCILIVVFWVIRKPAVPVPVSIPRAALIPPHVHIRGPRDAKYTLVEFGDYQCPPCARLHESLGDYEWSKGQVNFAFRNLPLPIHDQALKAANLVEAALNDNEYWYRHDLVYAFRAHLDDSLIEDLRMILPEHSVPRPFATQAIKVDVNDAVILGIQATPTLYLCRADGATWRISDLRGVEWCLREK